jgi:4-amino-4-deoxy-L-arabinose transferase-like glycosyltransferase
VSIVLDRPVRGAEAEQSPPRRLRLPIDAWICTGLLVAVLTIQAWNITRYPAVSDDEGTYLAQAWALQHGHGLAPYTYWYDHPPFGWMQIAAIAWLPALLFHGGLAVASARVIMLPVTAASSMLVYLLARRLTLPRWCAALAVVLFALSPLSVTLQREVFLDNFAVAWMLGAFVLTLSPRQHLWHHIGAGACAALAVLSKETMAIVMPAVLVALWQGSHRSTRKFSMVGFATALVLVGAQYPLFALLKGELFPGLGHVSLVGGLLFQMQRAGSGSMFVPGTGSYGILHAWLYYDPVLIVGGAGAAVLGLADRRLRAPALAAVLLCLVAMRPSGYLPAMYVIQVLPFFAIALAGLAARAVSFALTSRADAGAGRREPLVRRVVAVAAAVGSVGAYIVPLWYDGDYVAVTADPNASYVAAASWIRAHVPDPRHTRIVVDDALWPDMVRDGFQPGLGAIWFYKVDLDPAVKRTLPDGWRDIDYIVSSPTVRQDPSSLPIVLAALAHSRVLAVFGTGSGRIEIRRIVGGES